MKRRHDDIDFMAERSEWVRPHTAFDGIINSLLIQGIVLGLVAIGGLAWMLWRSK